MVELIVRRFLRYWVYDFFYANEIFLAGAIAYLAPAIWVVIRFEKSIVLPDQYDAATFFFGFLCENFFYHPVTLSLLSLASAGVGTTSFKVRTSRYATTVLLLMPITRLRYISTQYLNGGLRILVIVGLPILLFKLVALIQHAPLDLAQLAMVLSPILTGTIVWYTIGFCATVLLRAVTVSTLTSLLVWIFCFFTHFALRNHPIHTLNPYAFMINKDFFYFNQIPANAILFWTLFTLTLYLTAYGVFKNQDI